MKELKRKIRDLLSEKLSKYGFRRKKDWDIIRIVDNNIVQIISPGLSSRNEKYRAIMELHGIEPEVTIDNRELESYMPFVERFRKLVNEKG